MTTSDAALRDRLEHEIEYILDDDMSGEVRVTYADGRNEIKQARALLSEDIMRLVDGYVATREQQLLADIKASLPENRKGSPRLLPCPDGKQGCLVAHYGKDIIKTEREHGFNDCLSKVTAVLEGYQKQGKGGDTA